jgi:hypothetical protein
MLGIDEPLQEELVIPQGKTFYWAATILSGNRLPLDLTSYTATLVIRSNVIAEDGALFLTLASSGGIQLGNATNNIVLSASPAQTASLNFGAPTQQVNGALCQFAVYEMELIDVDGNKETLMSGRARLVLAVAE